MMKVAFVQVVDGLGETTRVVEVGWVVAWRGAAEGYLQVDVKILSRQEGDAPLRGFWYGASVGNPLGCWHRACGTRSDSVYSRD